MQAERTEGGRSRIDALLAVFRGTPSTTTTNGATTSSDDSTSGGGTAFLEPEEISARILKKSAKEPESTGVHGLGSTHRTNIRVTFADTGFTASGRGEIQASTEPRVLIFAEIRRKDAVPSTHTTVFGKSTGFGVTDDTEENTPE